MTIQAIIPLVIMGGAFLLIAIVAHTTGQGNLDHIKSKTVGDGQHGTARWATKKEIQQTFKHIPFRPEAWRKGKDLPTDQGLVLGCVGGGPDIGSLWVTLFKQRKKAPERPAIQALVDTDDIHCLMIGASGIGKTAFFLYPNLEYACACGMSFLALDTKGDLARNYGTIASRCYGYQVAVIDLRNPTRSDGYNLLTLINHYMDICREDSENLAARAKAEKYAKILSKTIVNPDGDASQYGQNAFFYASKYALSERLVCGECGTLYRRCTWTQKGVKRIVWRCVSRLDYGKKYCHNSPTLDEAPLQQAILTAISTMMASKETLIQQITGSLKAEVIPFPGGGLSVGDIDRRLADLETQFQKLLKQAANDPAAYSGQFKEILDEQTFLKEKRAATLAESKHNAEINQRIMDAAELLERDAFSITEWDESMIRQMVDTVKVMSKNKIIVTLKGGAEINQRLE